MSTSSIAPTIDVARPAFRFAREYAGAGPDWVIRWHLPRNCSLTPGQLFGFYGLLCVISMGVAGFFWLQGAYLVMPFAWLEMVVVGCAMLFYARHAADRESIAVSRDRLLVEHACGNRVERVEFPSAWVRVEPETGDRSLIELSGQGRRIAVGRFVHPALRRQLADELRLALRRSHQRAAAHGL